MGEAAPAMLERKHVRGRFSAMSMRVRKAKAHAHRHRWPRARLVLRFVERKERKRSYPRPLPPARAKTRPRAVVRAAPLRSQEKSEFAGAHSFGAPPRAWPFAVRSTSRPCRVVGLRDAALAVARSAPSSASRRARVLFSAGCSQSLRAACGRRACRCAPIRRARGIRLLAPSALRRASRRSRPGAALRFGHSSGSRAPGARPPKLIAPSAHPKRNPRRASRLGVLSHVRGHDEAVAPDMRGSVRTRQTQELFSFHPGRAEG